MNSTIRRRTVLGLSTSAALGVALGVPSVASANETPKTDTTPRKSSARVSAVYQSATRRAGGGWNSLITVAGSSGALVTAVQDKADEAVEAYSVNKIGVATAVLDKIDRGLLTLDQKVDVTGDIVATTGDGIFPRDGAYPPVWPCSRMARPARTTSPPPTRHWRRARSWVARSWTPSAGSARTASVPRLKFVA